MEALSLGMWENIRIVGKGGSSTVYKASLKSDPSKYIAVKQIETDGFFAEQISNIKLEIATIRELNHPNIISYLGTEQSDKVIYILLEYADRGSLRQYYQRKGALRETQAASCIGQILAGLDYLHNKRIAHRDIKCANCLLTASRECKLADFGASKNFLHDSIISGLKGTPNWMAPEVIKGTQMTTGWLKADVWSLGCTVVEMVSGNLPYSYYDNPMTAMYHIASGEVPSFRDLSVSSSLIAFVIACCASDPNCRPTAQELMQFEFVAPFTKVYLKAAPLESDVGGAGGIGGIAEVKVDDAPLSDINNVNTGNTGLQQGVGGLGHGNVVEGVVLSMDLFSSLDDSTESIVIPVKQPKAKLKLLNTLCLDDPLLISSANSTNNSPKRTHPQIDGSDNDLLPDTMQLQQKRFQEASTPLTTARKGIFYNEQGSKSRISTKVLRAPPTYPTPYSTVGKSPTNTVLLKDISATQSRTKDKVPQLTRAKDKVPQLTPKFRSNLSSTSSSPASTLTTPKQSANSNSNSNSKSNGLSKTIAAVDSKAVTPENTVRRVSDNNTLRHSKTESAIETIPSLGQRDLKEFVENFPPSNSMTTTESSDDSGLLLSPNERSLSPPRGDEKGKGKLMIMIDGKGSAIDGIIDEKTNNEEIKSSGKNTSIYQKELKEQLSGNHELHTPDNEMQGIIPIKSDMSPPEKCHMSPTQLSRKLNEITSRHTDNIHDTYNTQNSNNTHNVSDINNYDPAITWVSNDKYDEDSDFSLKNSKSESQKRENRDNRESNRENRESRENRKSRENRENNRENRESRESRDLKRRDDQNRPNAPLSGEIRRLKEPGTYDGLGPLNLFETFPNGALTTRSTGERLIGGPPIFTHTAGIHKQESISEKLERLSLSGAASIRMNALKEFEVLASQHEELAGDRGHLGPGQMGLNGGHSGGQGGQSGGQNGAKMSLKSRRKKNKLYNLNFDGISNVIRTYAQQVGETQFSSTGNNSNFRSQSAGMPVSTYGMGLDHLGVQNPNMGNMGFLGAFGTVQSGLVKVPVDPVRSSLYPLTLGVNLSQHLLPAINCMLPLQRRIIQSAPSLSRSVNLPPIRSLHGSLTLKGQKSGDEKHILRVSLYDKNDSKSFTNESEDNSIPVLNYITSNIGNSHDNHEENYSNNTSNNNSRNTFHNGGGEFVSEPFSPITRKER